MPLCPICRVGKMWEWRDMGKLSALAVKAVSERGRHGEGDGRYLHAAPSGT